MIRQATLDDIEFLAPRLREADRNEIKASGGEDPLTPFEEVQDIPSL